MSSITPIANRDDKREQLASAVIEKAHTYARAKCRAPHDLSDEAVDAATMAVVRALNRYDGIRNWEAYAMRSVAVAVRRAYRRWKARRKIIAQTIHAESGRSEPADHKPPLVAELSYEIRECLPPEVLAAVELVVISGHTRKEAAEILGVHSSTITRRMQVASVRIRGDSAVTMRRKNTAHRLKRRAPKRGLVASSNTCLAESTPSVSHQRDWQTQKRDHLRADAAMVARGNDAAKPN